MMKTTEVGKATDLGFDPEGGKWVTLCLEHHTVINSRSKADAQSAARWKDWCMECQIDMEEL